MFDRLFLAHPREVGESYGAHRRVALGFSVALFAAAFACLVHALVPGLFKTTASGIIVRLHARMTTNRRSVPQEAVRRPMDSNPSVL